MPEAPEVQTVISTLEVQIHDLQIEEVQVVYPKIVEHTTPEAFIKRLTGQHFRKFLRWGKYLLFVLDDYDLVVHLRMEGKFYLLKQPSQDKHGHIRFRLSDGRWMCYHDTRKFGRMQVYTHNNDPFSHPCFEKLGYDVLDPRLDGAYLYQKIHPLKKNLKSCLLDQSIVAGIGNIYADEICFACGLDPRSRSARISKKDCENLAFHTKRIMKGAMKAGGTTIRSYTSSLGVTGLFQLKLKVHAQAGKPCPNCETTIRKIIVSQRGTYLCPKCQKRK